MRKRRCLLLSLTLLINWTALARQTPAPQDEQGEIIRLNTELVQVRAVVTDRNGRPVDNLTRDDFEVFEDGRPQQISFFSVERAPGSSAAGGLPGDAAARRSAPARTVVLFVDTLHLAPANLFRAKHYMRRFVDRMMTDRDSVAVVTTSGTLGVLQQFTSDRRMLRYAIDKIQPFLRPATFFTPDLAAAVLAGDEGAVKAALTIMQDEEGYLSTTNRGDSGVATARAREILGEEDRLRRATLDTLAAVTDRLSRMKGQRLLAFVSNGFSSFDLGGTQDRLPLQRVMGGAARAGVAIYSIYGIGLYAGGSAQVGVPSAAGEYTLRELADETGGRAYINTNDMGESLQKMLDANSVYYTLAYYPPKGGDPSKFRKIVVRLKNHPGHSVSTQKGYVPPTPRADERAATPRERLFEEMVSPLPVTDIGVTSSASFLETAADDAQATLRVHMDGGGLKYEERGGKSLLRCEVVALALDKDGKVADTVAETIDAALDAGQVEEARREGFLYTKRLKLKPGLYQLRVGVREPGSGLTGTSSSWVEVPDLSQGRLALSSLFIGAAKDSGGTPGIAGRDGARNRPRLLLDDPSIKSGQSLFYRFVVYNAPSPEGVRLKVEVLQGESDVYEGDWQPLAARAVRSDSRGVEAGGQLKPSLPPGVYTLRVTAKDARSKKGASQVADFEVSP
jgi:VWFA-related protein